MTRPDRSSILHPVSHSGIQAARAAGIGLVIGLTSRQAGVVLIGGGAHETVENLGRIERERLFMGR